MTETVGDIIRDWRCNYRFVSQAHAAALVGTNPSSFGLWESGKRNPNRRWVVALAAVMPDSYARRLWDASGYEEDTGALPFNELFADTRRRYLVSMVMLAAATGVTHGFLYRWERGTRKPSRKDLQKVCVAMRVGPEDKALLFRAAGLKMKEE